MRIGLLAAAALLAIAGASAADEVKMKDGRVLEGKVLEETDASVRLRDRFGGETTLRREDVASIVRKELPEEAVARKRAALDPKDVEGRWALAREAREAKLRKPFEELCDEVLRLDPAHAGANEARGNVLFEGKWMKPAERDRLVADRVKADKAAQGLVEYQGRWVTPEEKDGLERGLVLHEGRWMSLREANLAKGLVEYKGGWVRKEELEDLQIRDTMMEAAGVALTTARSDRFQVAAFYNQADTNQLLQDAEKTYAEFARIFDVKPGERLLDDPFNRKERRCTIVVLDKAVQYHKFLDGLLRFHEELKKVTRPELLEFWRRQNGFTVTDPDCWIVGFLFPYPKEQMRHRVVHKLSHILVQRWHNKGSAWTQWWLVEGLGAMQEVNAFGNCQVYCITAGYGQKPGEDKFIGESWKAEAKKLAATGGDRKLPQLVTRGINELEPWDLIKSWSMVHYLVALDREKFARLVILLKEGLTAADAFPKVYEATLEQMDDRWREFVRRTY